MAIDKAVITADEQRLIDLVAMADKRSRRAREKRDAAQREVDEAIDWHAAAVARLDAWREAQPHQCNLPL